MSDDTQLNDQAKAAASAALGAPVVAASMCTRFGSSDRAAAVFGAHSLQGASLRLTNVFNRTARSFNQGLPEHFLVAVTETQVHALEAKEKHGELTAGGEYVVWDRAGLGPVLAPQQMFGTPADGQVVVVHPPPDMRSMSRANKKVAMAVGRGVPVQLLFGKDATSQSVVDVLVADGHAQGARQPIVWNSNSGVPFPGLPGAAPPAAPAAPAADTTVDQLEKLADLHSKGVLDDAEFAAQKARILNEA